MDLDKLVTEAITRLLGSTAKICVRSYTRDHIPGESEFVAVAWLGGREPRFDFAWIRLDLADPYFYRLQTEEAPVEAFVTIDELVKHIDRLAQKALQEEAADEEVARAAAAVSGRPLQFEQMKARMRPGDIVIKKNNGDDHNE